MIIVSMSSIVSLITLRPIIVVVRGVGLLHVDSFGGLLPEVLVVAVLPIEFVMSLELLIAVICLRVGATHVWIVLETRLSTTTFVEMALRILVIRSIIVKLHVTVLTMVILVD